MLQNYIEDGRFHGPIDRSEIVVDQISRRAVDVFILPKYIGRYGTLYKTTMTLM